MSTCVNGVGLVFFCKKVNRRVELKIDFREPWSPTFVVHDSVGGTILIRQRHMCLPLSTLRETQRRLSRR